MITTILSISYIHSSYFLNRLLAKGIIPLGQLVSHGSLKYQVELTDPDNNKLESVN